MNIFLTLDYELFMGDQTGSPMNCLIEPMNALCAMAKQHDVRFVIFADAAYLLRLWELSDVYPSLKTDFVAVRNHLTELCKDGHDVEFHFHPQWLYSEYDETRRAWIMDREHYKLSDMPKEDIYDKFPKAKALLDSIIGYKTTAFRAGGYSLTSFTGYYELLVDNGIKIDSSVHCRSKVNGKYQSYDYSQTPKNSHWRFEQSVDNITIGGGILEMPISYSSWYPGFLYLIKKRQLEKKFGSENRWFTGTGVTSFLSRKDWFLGQIKKFFHGIFFTASIDSFMSENLVSMYKYCHKQNRANMVIIGHPKCASPESVSVLEQFLSIIPESEKVVTFKDLES